MGKIKVMKLTVAETRTVICSGKLLREQTQARPKFPMEPPRWQRRVLGAMLGALTASWG